MAFPGSAWVQVEPSAVEVEPRLEVRDVAETTDPALDLLDLACPQRITNVIILSDEAGKCWGGGVRQVLLHIPARPSRARSGGTPSEILSSFLAKPRWTPRPR